MLFYHGDNFGVGYNQQVDFDNMMYHIVQDNHWSNLTLHKNANDYLVSFE